MAPGWAHDVNGQGRRFIGDQNLPQAPRRHVEVRLIGHNAGKSQSIERGVDRGVRRSHDQAWFDRDGGNPPLAMQRPTIGDWGHRRAYDHAMIGKILRRPWHAVLGKILRACIDGPANLADADCAQRGIG